MDIFGKVVIGGLIIIFMVTVPLYMASKTNEDTIVSQAQQLIDETCDKVVRTGIFSMDDYNDLQVGLDSLGLAAELSISIQVLDENRAKEESTGTSATEGQYILYEHTQVMEMLNEGDIILSAGDIFSAEAESIGTSIRQQLDSATSLTGETSSVYSVRASGMVSANGN